MAAAEPSQPPRGIVAWLSVCTAMVLAMAVIGAITRLTESGLSIAEWRPITGLIPPLTDAEWQRVFGVYKQTPEFRLINNHLDLEGFQQIFFWEWLHRAWGRLIGVVFVVPGVWYLLRGKLSRPLTKRLLLILALGAAQGLVGWVMVLSGLVDRPRVSHYRLALHLSMAVIIYAALLWTALELWRPSQPAVASPKLRRHANWGLAMVSVTMLWGALVAGLDAGMIYNTFPLMGGRWLPTELGAITPLWLDPVQNMVTVQLIHRWLAIGTAAWLIMLWVRARRSGLGRWLVAALPVVVLGQVGLGIATLLLQVPVWLGAAHQAGALVLFALLVALRFELRATASSLVRSERAASQPDGAPASAL